MPPVQGLDSAAYSFCGIHLWSLGLPILNRLYTSVIVPDPEKWTYKESWATDLSPTALFTPRDRHGSMQRVDSAGRRGVPGVRDEGGSRRVLPGYSQDHPRDPY